jgi:hypothetical protein
MKTPKGHGLRFKVEPGDVPPEKAARRLHLTLAEFEAKLGELRQRGFPAPDPTTGMYDLEAIDAWRRARNPQAFGLTVECKPRDARNVVGDRIAALANGRR